MVNNRSNYKYVIKDTSMIILDTQYIIYSQFYTPKCFNKNFLKALESLNPPILLFEIQICLSLVICSFEMLNRTTSE